MKPIILVAVVAIVVVAVAAVVMLGGKSGGTTPAPSTGGGGGGGTPLVGNDSDAHGCKGSAGYSWCEAKQKCLRIWEEPCETGCVPDPNKACTLEYMPVCGNDGVTYGNRCAAEAVCAEIAHEGECATGSGAGDCACPTGYKKEGDVCNPECYHSNPPCLAPSVPCELSGIPESTCNSACIAADYASGSCKWSSEAQSGESLLIACIGEGSKHCTGGACNCYCSGSIGLANPASVYCEQQGGILSILTVANNGVEGEVGMCELEDGRTCEEWALFRSDGANCTDENGFPA